MLDTLKNAYDLAQNLRTMQVSTELNSKISELLAQIISAREKALTLQSKNSALLGEIADLKQKLAQRADWQAEREKYVLKPVMGSNFAYFDKAALQPGQAAQAFCQNCFEHERKSPLQVSAIASVAHYECPKCGAKFGGMKR